MSHAAPTPTLSLHRAAAIRAYRTLAQGLGGTTVTTALVALVAALGDADALRTAALAAVISLGTISVSAVASFWQGVAQGLPEVEDPATPVASSVDPD